MEVRARSILIACFVPGRKPRNARPWCRRHHLSEALIASLGLMPVQFHRSQPLGAVHPESAWVDQKVLHVAACGMHPN
jgi:hypothetical protein